MVWIGEVGVQLFPGVPQVCVHGPGEHALILHALVFRFAAHIRQQGVEVQQRPNVDDVGVGVAALAHSLVVPVEELCPLLLGGDVFVVLQVVADDEVRPPLLMPPAADLLS